MNKAPVLRRPRLVGRSTVLILGVLVIPFALSVALNSYGPLTVHTALRMAFATVAGQTIAILGAIAALALAIKRGYAWPAIIAFGLIAVVITTWAIGSMASAGTLLIDRLDLVAEVDQLNT
jgi:Co/Zn/Cd efflux system component